MKQCVAENEDGSSCEKEATRKQGAFWVCEPHGSGLWNYIRLNTRDKLIYQMVEDGNVSRHSYGITYFLILPNKNIKIGFTRDSLTLVRRIKDLKREFNGDITLAATAYGGESLEAYYHYKFKDHRIRSMYLEQFYPATVILKEIRSVGMVNQGRIALDILKQEELTRLSGFQKLNNPLEKRRRNVRKVSCPLCKSPVDQPCIEDGNKRNANHKARADLYSKMKDKL